LKTISEHISFLQAMLDKGGPERSEWPEVRMWMNEAGSAIEKREYRHEEVDLFYQFVGDSFSRECIQGLTYHKPRKYAGDFELLDKIQTGAITEDPGYKKWDEYFHSCEAPRAVRFRIDYLHEILNTHIKKNTGAFSFLNIASGPCRDLKEFYKKFPDAAIAIECVEHEPEAIEYAKHVMQEKADGIVFHQTNFIRFQYKKKYHLQWSAGLFDYLNDETFIRILARMMTYTEPGGEIVIGNLFAGNPSRYYMVLFKWLVYHRSREHLFQLAKDAGASPDQIYIYKEPLDVNLFLHIAC
jgi:extracellular factor (EF) 3-hydroxypalmitic acid methyl ester biosynthesis protein